MLNLSNNYEGHQPMHSTCADPWGKCYRSVCGNGDCFRAPRWGLREREERGEREREHFLRIEKATRKTTLQEKVHLEQGVILQPFVIRGWPKDPEHLGKMEYENKAVVLLWDSALSSGSCHHIFSRKVQLCGVGEVFLNCRVTPNNKHN